MSKNNVEIFETIFETHDVANTRKKLSVRHREFNIIHREEEDTIFLSSSSTFAGKVEIYQRRVIKIINH